MKRMNSAIKYLFVLLLLFASCEKAPIDDDVDDGKQEQPGDSGDKDANVRVRVVQVEGASNLDERFSRLEIAVYNTEKRLKTIHQLRGETSFGEAGIRLSEGSYRLVVIGHSSNDSPTMTTPEKIHFTNAMGYTDTYYYYEAFTVGDQPIEKNVALAKASTTLRVVSTDVKMAEAKKLRIYYTGGSGELDATTGYGTVASRQTVMLSLPDSLTGHPVQFNAYTFLHAEEGLLNVTITTYDENDGTIMEYTTDDTELSRTDTLELRGPLFSTVPVDPDTATTTSSSASVTINGQWAGYLHYSY